jgi:hypothetical protein
MGGKYVYLEILEGTLSESTLGGSFKLDHSRGVQQFSMQPPIHFMRLMQWVRPCPFFHIFLSSRLAGREQRSCFPAFIRQEERFSSLISYCREVNCSPRFCT